MILMNSVTCLASMEKTFADIGVTSVWDFFSRIAADGTETLWAQGGTRGRTIHCKDRDELRNIFRNFRKYGYVAV